ncbi:MAG: hypothetical protein GC161_16265 [Planctomycetaceae bacterium]|nr:hypothetical protein [Planctomycetaceae bacterium]
MGTKRRNQPLSEERKALFLAVLAQVGNIGEAARQASPNAVGDASATFRDARRRDPEGFGAAVEDALEAFRDRIRQEAYRRGIQGVPVDVIGPTGTVIGQRIVASDRVLLELMRGRLKEHQPIKRVEAVVEQTVTQRKPNDLAMKLEELTPENRRKLKEILEDQLARRKRGEHSETTAAQPTDGPEGCEL